MERPMQLVAAALLAAGSLLAAPEAGAQMTQPSGTVTTAPTVPDEKLDAAAVAISRVSAISQQYEQRFNSAPPEDRARIADEADAALEQAVNESGLSVEEYNNIVEIAQADPEVQEKLLQRLQVPVEQE
ncbi:MAG TPA: DUF4168 domain-containing protein [Alphaproteobacteria bacterium]|nr:DUF4168 domain-containing protein [Alphaproteobacteria bacterium]